MTDHAASNENLRHAAERRHERHSRTRRLREIGEDGMDALSRCAVLIAGLGGTGSTAARLITGAGVGTVGLADPDTVDLSNLPRQILYAERDIGRPKREAAREALSALDAQGPLLRLTELPEDPEGLRDALACYDVTLDCTDNYPSRFALHDAAREAGTPIIHAAAEGWTGYVTLFDHGPNTPCLRCFLPPEAARTIGPGCSGVGVLPALPSMIGAMAAAEALKFLTGAGRTLAGRLLRYDALEGTAKTVRLAPAPDCSCGAFRR